jgi:hypothetical protein
MRLHHRRIGNSISSIHEVTMATWKARITEKTNLDASGMFEVAFNILRPTGQVLILNGITVERRTSGLPTTITTNIKQEVTRIAQEVVESTRLQVGDLIDVEV